MDETDTAKVRSLRWWQWVAVLAITTGLTAAFYWEIPAFAVAIDGVYFYPGNNAPHILDACTNGLSIVAQALLLGRYWEQWILWITIDVLQIAMYSGVAGYGWNINVLTMWCFFLVNAIFGLAAWILRWRHMSQQAGASSTVTSAAASASLTAGSEPAQAIASTPSAVAMPALLGAALTVGSDASPAASATTAATALDAVATAASAASPPALGAAADDTAAPGSVAIVVEEGTSHLLMGSSTTHGASHTALLDTAT